MTIWVFFTLLMVLWLLGLLFNVLLEGFIHLLLLLALEAALSRVIRGNRPACPSAS